MRLLAVVATALFLAAPAAAAPVPLPAAPGCPLFPETNVWNKPVGKLPLRSNSRKVVRAIGARLPVHADFGSGLWEGAPIGIPITVVDSSQATSAVDFHYDGESDAGLIRSRTALRSRVATTRTATGMQSSSTPIPARSTSSSPSTPRRGARARARSGA